MSKGKRLFHNGPVGIPKSGRRIFYHDREIGLTKPFPSTIIEGLQEIDVELALEQGREDAPEDVPPMRKQMRSKDPEV
jgi:hypothetical protein